MSDAKEFCEGMVDNLKHNVAEDKKRRLTLQQTTCPKCEHRFCVEIRDGKGESNG